MNKKRIGSEASNLLKTRYRTKVVETNIAKEEAFVCGGTNCGSVVEYVEGCFIACTVCYMELCGGCRAKYVEGGCCDG